MIPPWHCQNQDSARKDELYDHTLFNAAGYRCHTVETQLLLALPHLSSLQMEPAPGGCTLWTHRKLNQCQTSFLCLSLRSLYWTPLTVEFFKGFLLGIIIKSVLQAKDTSAAISNSEVKVLPRGKERSMKSQRCSYQGALKRSQEDCVTRE